MDTRKKIIIAVVVIAALVGAYFLFATPKTDEEAAKTAPGAAPQPGVATGPAASANPLTSPQPGVGVSQAGPAVNPSADIAQLEQIPGITKRLVPGLGLVTIITKADRGEVAIGQPGWADHVAYILGGKIAVAGTAEFNNIAGILAKMGKTDFGIGSPKATA
jgi:hypothetical protein